MTLPGWHVITDGRPAGAAVGALLVGVALGALIVYSGRVLRRDIRVLRNDLAEVMDEVRVDLGDFGDTPGVTVPDRRGGTVAAVLRVEAEEAERHAEAVERGEAAEPPGQRAAMRAPRTA